MERFADGQCPSLTSKIRFVKPSHMRTHQGKLRLCIVITLFSISLVWFIYLLPFSSTQAAPNCNDNCEAGHTACMNWCVDHNKTTKSRKHCLAGCDAYWYSGKNPQSIGPADPSNPPRKGPGNISGLPESNPTPTPRKGPGKIGTTGIGKASPAPTPSATKPPVLLKESGSPSPTPTRKKDHHHG